MNTTAPNRCRPPKEWPPLDQAAWEAALRPGDPFNPGGRASRWSAATRRKVVSGYGRWLTWLDEQRLLEPLSSPADRIIRDCVRRYYEHLRETGGPSTVKSRIQELGDAMRALAPEGDWRWITRASGRLQSYAAPIRQKQLQSPDRLASLGKQLMAEADTMVEVRPVWAALKFRDGLIIALLAYRPLRGRNLQMTQCGQNLVLRNGSWSLVFAPEETKGGRWLEMLFPTDLIAALERYLTTYRPILLTRGGKQAPAAVDALWISREGRAMAYHSIAVRVSEHTGASFGTPLRPHAFRHCAATTIAIADPEHVRIVTALLGHACLNTSERYYNLAGTLEAGRRYHAAIAARRRNSRLIGEEARATRTEWGDAP